MTLDEAIKHCKEHNSCNEKCNEEHKQLASWLEELKEYKKTGYWIKDNLIGWKCSNCKKHIVLNIDLYGNYCPNCGTRMSKQMAMDCIEKSVNYSQSIRNPVKKNESDSIKRSDAIEAVASAAETIEVVRCKECKHQDHCYETVAHKKKHDGFIEYWSEPIEWCSRGERKGGELDD